MKTLKSYVLRQQFDPGILGLFINPFYIERRELIKTLRRLAPHITGKILDVGCGHRPYKEVFSAASSSVGMEYDTPKNRARFKEIDVWYSGGAFPLDGTSFDSVIMTEVMEHVFEPDQILSEVNRVLRPGGIVLLSAPFAWDEHEQPYDYARYSSFGFKHLLTKHGFEVVEHIKSTADIRVIFQLTGCYVHKKLSWIKSYYPRILFYVLLISPLTILGTALSWILPNSADLYIENIFMARKR
ncbi:MAG TPA: class I SAM-dependent methyltransferase [Candidatus Paceibacterota bacterium]|jgi:2-polyprenyl-3-methyl-5-hydroxy-6-metoxy-1,4-benzoquinol methylase